MEYRDDLLTITFQGERMMEHSFFSKNSTNLYWFLGVIVIGLYAVFAYKADKAFIDIVTTEGNSLRIGLESNQTIAIDKLLENLLTDDNSKELAKVILREFHDIYELDDKLVNKIRSADPTDTFSKGMRALLENHEGPFAAGYHAFADTSKVSVIEQILNHDDSHEVKKRLKSMAENNEYPFVDDPVDIQVIAQGALAFSDEFAATCGGNDFIGRNVVLRNSANGAMVQVFVRNTFPCTQNRNILQITEDKADVLFGNLADMSDNGAILMTVAKPGMKFDIVPISIQIAHGGNGS